MSFQLWTDLFKALYLWDISRWKKNEIKATFSSVIWLSIGVLTMHFISIASTSFYLFPSILNMFEGALYEANISLKSLGVETDIVGFAKIASITLSTILELITVFVIRKFLAEHSEVMEQEKKGEKAETTTLKVLGFVLVGFVFVQAYTAYGGLKNSYRLYKTPVEDREYLASLRKELDGIVTHIAQEQKLLQDVRLGKIELSKKDLQIKEEDSTIEVLRKDLNSIEQQLEVALKGHNEYAQNIRDIYSKKHRYTLAEEKIKRHYNQNVAPLLKKKQLIIQKLEKKSSEKTHFTVQEWIDLKEKFIKELKAQKEYLYKYIKDRSEEIRKMSEVSSEASVWFAIAVLIFLLIQGAFGRYKDLEVEKLYRLLDRGEKNSRKNIRNKNIKQDIHDFEEENKKIEELNEELKELEKESEELFIYDFTQDVLDFMRGYYKAKNELPSIAIIQDGVVLKEHEVKKARKELKAKGFYYEENTKTYPTEKFLEKIDT